MAGDAGADPGAGTFGSRLRRARTQAGLSQTALAGDDLSPSYISHLESDRREPTAAVAALLAGRLGVSRSDLVGAPVEIPEHDLVLAEAALGLGNPDESLALLTPWQHRWATLDDLAGDRLAFRAAEVQAAAFERAGRLSEAARVLERLHRAAQVSPSRLPWVAVTVSLLRVYRESGDVARAVDLGEAALRRGADLRIDHVPGFAPLVSTVAGVYAERGDLLRAQVILDELLERLDDVGTDDDRVKALWNAAINATERGHAGEGMRLAEEATQLASHGSDLLVRARLRYSRAWILLQQQPPQAELAREELRALLPDARQHGGAMLLGQVLSELARAELLLGRPEVARRHARASLERLDDQQVLERGHTLVLLGAASVSLGEVSVGVALLEDAAALLGEAGTSRYGALAWRQLAEVFLALGDPGRAVDALQHALDTAGLASAPMLPVAGSADPRVGSRRSRTTV